MKKFVLLFFLTLFTSVSFGAVSVESSKCQFDETMVSQITNQPMVLMNEVVFEISNPYFFREHKQKTNYNDIGISTYISFSTIKLPENNYRTPNLLYRYCPSNKLQMHPARSNI